MKKTILLLLAFGLPWAVKAQVNSDNEKDRAAYLEIGGGSTGAGVSYDARFNSHTRWGWRAGFGWGYTEDNDVLDNYSSLRAYTVPVEVNYLVGNRRNSLELGFGVSLGVYNGHRTDVVWHEQNLSREEYEHYMADPGLLPGNCSLYADADEQQFVLTTYDSYGRSENVFGYYFYGNVGWRHVSRSGFMLRMGLSPSFNFGGSHAVSKTLLYPYISLGWAF